MRVTVSNILFLLLLGVTALPAAAGAQPPEGTVRITIQDQTGAILPFARASLVNETGETLEVTPDERGVAVITGVPYGAWLLTVQADGFQPFEQLLTVNRADIDATVQLQVALHEEIEIVGDEMRSPGRSGSAFSFTLTAEEIAALPDDPEEMEEALRQMAGPGAQIFVDGFGGGRLPPKNQIQQIRFRTNPFSAENHHAGMVRIDVITRPGMSRWGGMANFGFRDDVMNARNAFAPEKGDEQQNRFMVNVGGPLGGRTSFGLSVDGQISHDSETILAALPGETLNSQVLRPLDTANVRFTLDHAFGETNQLKAIVEHRTIDRRNLGVGGFDLPERAYTSAMTADQIRVISSRAFGTRVFSELRVSFTAQSTEDIPLSDAPTVRVLDAFTTGGAGRSGTRQARQFEIGHDVDFTVGRHTMRAGVLLEGGWWHSTSAANTNGSFTFATLEEYLMGRPSLYTRRVGETAVSYGHLQAGWYIQDDFRLGRDLSLGVGLRQEVQTHLPDKWNLAPRAAFTWTPGGGSTTIRGGWGLFYDWYDAGLHEQTLRLDGILQEEIIIVDPGYPDADVGGGVSLPPSVIRVADGLVMPTIRQTSIGVERPLAPWLNLRSDYTRLRGSNTFRSINANAPVDGVRPDPEFGNISEIGSTGRLQTDRLTVGLRAMVPAPRISVGATYQLAKSEDFADTALSLPSDNADPDADWGPAAHDVRHRLSFMGSVPLPLRLRLGFQMQAASATPYNITTGTDDNGDTVFNDRPEGVGRNSARGSATWNTNVRFSRSFGFGGPSAETRGTGAAGGPMVMGGGGAARGTGAGGGGVPVMMEGGTSRFALDLHVQAFNVLNRANYTHFVGNMRSPFFGTATSAAPARRIEVGVTFRF